MEKLQLDKELFDTFLTLLVGLIAIINPMQIVPMWLSLTREMTDDERQSTLKRVYGYTLLLLIIFMLLGQGILEFFGLSITAIKLAGSVFILITALNMLVGPAGGRKRVSDEAVKKAQTSENDIAFTPVAMPLIVGPGVIAVMLDYGGQIGNIWQSWHAATVYLLWFAAIILAASITYLSLRYSKYLLKVLGHGGISAMTRFFAFLLLSVGAKFFISAVRDIVLEMKAL